MCAWRQMTPLGWNEYVHKHVTVTAFGPQQHTGWVHTVDPVSASVVLVSFEEQQEQQSVQVRVVQGHAVQQVQVLDEGDEDMAERLRSLFVLQGALWGPEEVGRRREAVRRWLQENRVPLLEDGDTLCVAGVLTLAPPYRPEDCSSSNQIILDRVQTLLKKCPTHNAPGQPGETAGGTS